MLPAAHRLRRSVDFQRAVRSGVRAGGSMIVVHLATDPDGTPPPQVGFVVSKAVGNAVHRNAVKRRLRAAASSELEGLPEHSRLVVRALPSSNDATFAELASEMSIGVVRAARRLSQRDAR